MKTQTNKKEMSAYRNLMQAVFSPVEQMISLPTLIGYNLPGSLVLTHNEVLSNSFSLCPNLPQINRGLTKA